MGRGRKSDAVAIGAAERTIKALELRGQRLSYRSIAKQLGISHTQARRDISQAFDLLKTEKVEAVELMRVKLLERLEYLFELLLPQIECDNPDPKAIDIARKLTMSAGQLGGVLAPRPADAQNVVNYYEMHFDTTVHEREDVIVYPNGDADELP